jgi:phosphatidylserine/phosphatidylglycerophosphate/cardiolipin synthase-like enzyme
MILDRHLVVGGSYNYTLNAELRNTENVTLTASDALAARYLENWNERRDVSMPYAAPMPLWQRLFVW